MCGRGHIIMVMFKNWGCEKICCNMRMLRIYTEILPFLGIRKDSCVADGKDLGHVVNKNNMLRVCNLHIFSSFPPFLIPEHPD